MDDDKKASNLGKQQKRKSLANKPRKRNTISVVCDKCGEWFSTNANDPMTICSTCFRNAVESDD